MPENKPEQRRMRQSVAKGNGGGRRMLLLGNGNHLSCSCSHSPITQPPFDRSERAHSCCSLLLSPPHTHSPSLFPAPVLRDFSAIKVSPKEREREKSSFYFRLLEEVCSIEGHTQTRYARTGSHRLERARRRCSFTVLTK